MKFKLRNKLMVIQISVLIFSLATSFTATFAWYVASRQTTLTISNITTETGMTYTLKYLTDNGDTGYEESDGVTVTDYSTDFTEVVDPANSPFNISYFQPGRKYTYSLEVEAGFAETSLVRLDITDFTSSFSTSLYNNNNDAGVSLASAINFYGTCVDYNASNITSDANSFVTDTALFDKFDYDASDIAEQEIASGNLGTDYPVDTGMIVFFFSIEFSNESDTFLTESGSDETWTYYSKNPLEDDNTISNSNPYRNMDFTLSELELTKEFLGEIRLDTRGGTISGGEDTEYSEVETDDTYTLPTPTRTGYTFSGWYDSVNDATTSGGATWTVPASIPTTLYATWTANSYTVSYDAVTNGGTAITSTDTIQYNTCFPSSLPTATKTDSTFDGWYLDSVATTDKVEAYDAFLLSANTTLYAHYS
jgi:uncharacterized repeat protein (TIGR02543 family)